jgi:D-alanyl-D-alanine carboxypeptidase/D-alanyl-D-alanine-endopeptidase (penicillin-binding protein 4)
MMYAKGNDLFYRSLPVSGVNGTLRNRLKLPETQGKIRAKTGTLRGVRSLSGYLEHPYYGTILFSIMVNQPSQSGQVLVGAIDEIALRLAQLTPCQ